MKSGSKSQVLSHLADTPHFHPLSHEYLTNTTVVGGELDTNQGSDEDFNTTPFVPLVRSYDAPKGKLWFMPPGEAPVRVEEPEVSYHLIHSPVHLRRQT